MRSDNMTADEFVAHVINRMRAERADLSVKHLHGLFLVVEHQGRQRVVSLANVYHGYTRVPVDLEMEVTNFLASLVYDEPPGVKGGFDENQYRILPQVVPPALVEFCRRDGKDLPVIPFVSGLSVAFVVDEPQRYCYVNAAIQERWCVSDATLLQTALENLRRQTEDEVQLLQVGVGETAMYLYESFDGYDASRILLSSHMMNIAAKVSGALLVGIPNRDFLVAFGSANQEFVQHMRQQIEDQYTGHSYAICPDLLHYEDGNWSIQGENTNEIRVLN